MKNNILLKLDRIIEIRISGKNVYSYIKRVIIKNKINIFKLTYLNYKEVLVTLKYEDYLKLCEYKSVYDIEIVNKYGTLSFVDKLKKNSILIFFLILGIILISFLSKFILDIDVIHSSVEVRNLLFNELEEYDISKYKLKKGYYELEKIEDKILEDNKDRLEWIEIIESGTKYIVRVEERKLNLEEKRFQYQSIVSSKNCVLYEVDAVSGEKVKRANDYVKKGDTVISGYITLPNGSTNMTMAKGKVLGEVWYTIEVDYPYTYYEERLTGKSKKFFVINFLGYKIPIFQFNKYRSFNKKSRIIFENNITDISFSRETQYEVEVISNIYTYDEALNMAIGIGKDKLINDNNKIEKIGSVDILEERDTGSGVYVKLFVKAIEDVSQIVKIDLDNISNN